MLGAAVRESPLSHADMKGPVSIQTRNTSLFLSLSPFLSHTHIHIHEHSFTHFPIPSLALPNPPLLFLTLHLSGQLRSQTPNPGMPRPVRQTATFIIAARPRPPNPHTPKVYLNSFSPHTSPHLTSLDQSPFPPHLGRYFPTQQHAACDRSGITTHS